MTAIYNDAVARTTGTFDTEPKTLDQQREWFDRHGASHPVLVAEEAGRVVGWASLSPWSDRCAYARTAEVSVYVDESSRGGGSSGPCSTKFSVSAGRRGCGRSWRGSRRATRSV